MREFAAASGSLSFTGGERKQIYGLGERTLQAHEYLRLSKKDKGVVRRYLAKISGRSLAQITRLDPMLPPKRGRRARPAPPASLPAPLHTRRHRSVVHGRCSPRRAVGPGAAAHPMARIPRLRPGRLPTIGLPVGLAHLQPAAQRGLSPTPRPSHPDALARGGHRRAATAQPVRQHIGHEPIAAEHAAEFQRFYTACFNPYLNYHRPRGFATVEVSDNGKRRRRYWLGDYRTPYEKLVSLEPWEGHLKEGISAAMLEQQARRMSDTECARHRQQRKRKLLASCRSRW